MATVTITAPDAWVPRIVAAIKARYPDLTGTDAEVAREGVARMLRDSLRTAEYSRVEAELKAQFDAERATRLTEVDSVLALIK